MFNQSRNFTVTGGTFIDGNVTYHFASSNQFMKELLEKTIPGAEFDSSDRDPPPRCHPGTRLAVLERCLYFISHCDGVKKMRWVFGAAGVGKSAIMQSVIESPELSVSSHASVFFSINGRDDGTKAIITLSYQFAAKSDSYRQIIEQEITRDPSLLRSSMAKQFNKLIVEPFVRNDQLKSAGRVLVIVDGLDECRDHRTQQELLRLISDLCLTYPSSPLVWLIASRPEPQITSFFSKPNVIPAYEREEILVDSAEACADVERLLREKLTEIKEESDSLDSRWPEERDIWKLASAAGGLFAYAQTVIRYIGDSRIGSPVSQLSDVLHVIDEHPMTDLSPEEHPMALLDALYERILSNVPRKIMINTRKLLLALVSGWRFGFGSTRFNTNFIVLCNWLGMTADEAYAAVNYLRSILYIPPRDKALEDNFRAFHKSFIDYLSDFARSKFSSDIHHEANRLNIQCIFRFLNEAPDGVRLCKSESSFHYGNLACGPVTYDKIALTWLVEDGWNDDHMRLGMYKMAIYEVVNGMKRRDPIFQSELCIRFLATTFDDYSFNFPYRELCYTAFDESRRLGFIANGILKPLPLEAVSISRPYGFVDVRLRFRRPATAVMDLSDPWNSSCKHEREGEQDAGKVHNWMTTFPGNDCSFCFERLKYQLQNWKAHTALVFFTSTGDCCTEAQFIDREDGISEWTYSVWSHIPQEERKKYESTV